MTHCQQMVQQQQLAPAPSRLLCHTDVNCTRSVCVCIRCVNTTWCSATNCGRVLWYNPDHALLSFWLHSMLTRFAAIHQMMDRVLASASLQSGMTRAWHGSQTDCHTGGPLRVPQAMPQQPLKPAQQTQRRHDRRWKKFGRKMLSKPSIINHPCHQSRHRHWEHHCHRPQQQQLHHLPRHLVLEQQLAVCCAGPTLHRLRLHPLA